MKCANCNGRGNTGSDGLFNINPRECRMCKGSGYVPDKETNISQHRKDEEYLRKHSRLPEICFDLLKLIANKGLSEDKDFKKLAEYWAGLNADAEPQTINVVTEMSRLARK